MKRQRTFAFRKALQDVLIEFIHIGVFGTEKCPFQRCKRVFENVLREKEVDCFVYRRHFVKHVENDCFV